MTSEKLLAIDCEEIKMLKRCILLSFTRDEKI